MTQSKCCEFCEYKPNGCKCKCHTQSTDQDWRERFRKEFEFKIIPDDIGKNKEAEMLTRMYWLPIETFIQQLLDRQRSEIREWIIENNITIEGFPNLLAFHKEDLLNKMGCVLPHKKHDKNY